MKIGNLEFSVPVFLAPMAGVTDTPYRILAREMGCELVYSEMVSDKGINYRNAHTLEMLHTEPAERPIAMQLFGAEPQSVVRAAQYVESLGCADILDFNMGCPAPKVVKNHEGSALMRDPQRAFAILKALRQAVRLPVTVKMRLGWDEENINVLEMARLAEEAGMDAIAVHGRTREQFYRGQADWEQIAAVKQAVSIPVIANGDVRTCADLAQIFAVTGCDGVMIGRAAREIPGFSAGSVNSSVRVQSFRSRPFRSVGRSSCAIWICCCSLRAIISVHGKCASMPPGTPKACPMGRSSAIYLIRQNPGRILCGS